jgi:hypothetical protein
MSGGTLLHDLRALLDTAEPALLGPERRPPSLSLPELDRELATTFARNSLTPSVQQLLRSITYLWHDFLEESHRIAQEIESPDGSLVHGIMHRREPDYGNAKYWFRRVGAHPSFLSLAIRAGELLQHHAEGDLHSRLVPNKMWDPFAFVDAVEDAETGRFASKAMLLREVQKIEFECLVENIVNRL